MADKAIAAAAMPSAAQSMPNARPISNPSPQAKTHGRQKTVPQAYLRLRGAQISVNGAINRSLLLAPTNNGLSAEIKKMSGKKQNTLRCKPQLQQAQTV
jgi:hypothetical protein